ncbi:MAG: hypothetical protein FWG65_03740, partial [Turicibacter sp.]|nr:hypothetical protein [Turicibacter sp.]
TAHGSRLTAHGSRLTAHGSRLILIVTHNFPFVKFFENFFPKHKATKFSARLLWHDATPEPYYSAVSPSTAPNTEHLRLYLYMLE